jgi:hypothetical protein
MTDRYGNIKNIEWNKDFYIYPHFVFNYLFYKYYSTFIIRILLYMYEQNIPHLYTNKKLRLRVITNNNKRFICSINYSATIG